MSAGHGRAVPVACGLAPGVRLGGDPVPRAVIARGGSDPQFRSRPRQHPRGVAPAVVTGIHAHPVVGGLGHVVLAVVLIAECAVTLGHLGDQA